jgi:hypothetical protein
VRILTDQDVYLTTLLFLRDLGHDVVSAVNPGMERARDEELLRFSQKEKRIVGARSYIAHVLIPGILKPFI